MMRGSFFGCLVSGATFRQLCRANNRQTTEAFTGCPIRCARADLIGERTIKPASWACSAHGFRKSTSSSDVSNDFRRPPQLRFGDADVRLISRRICIRFTDAVPTPSKFAVSLRERPALAGSRTASADLKSSRFVVDFTVRVALATSFKSICIGLAIHGVKHSYTHLESKLESVSQRQSRSWYWKLALVTMQNSS